MSDLFQQLNEAIDSGDLEEMEKLRKQILSGCRDDKVEEALMQSLKGKQIYKNIAGVCEGSRELSKHDYMKMISSLITHSIIESEVREVDLSELPIKELYVILGDMINGSEGAVNNVQEYIKERYSKFLL